MDLVWDLALIAMGIVGGIALLLLLVCLGADAVQKLRIHMAMRECYAATPHSSGGAEER